MFAVGSRILALFSDFFSNTLRPTSSREGKQKTTNNIDIDFFVLACDRNKKTFPELKLFH